MLDITMIIVYGDDKKLLLGGPGLGLPEPDHEVPGVLALLHPHAAQQARHLLGHPADQRLVTLAATFILFINKIRKKILFSIKSRKVLQNK